MKAVPKVGLNGLYIEDVLVDDAFTGVVPFYSDPPESDPDSLSEIDTEVPDELPEETESEPSGYIVGVPVPTGLFQPRFDLAAWDKDNTLAPEDYWKEGMTPGEIEELTRPQPQETTPTDLLGAELTAMKLQNIEQQAMVSALGSELTAAKLDSIQQQQTISALGAELAAAKLEIIQLKGAD